MLTATRDLTVDAAATAAGNAAAGTNSAGLGSGVHANASLTLRYTTTADIAGTLTAGADLTAGSHTTVNGSGSATAQGGGLGVDADATMTVTVDANSVTRTSIRGTARLTGERVEVAATVDPLYARSYARSLAEAFGARSDANATVSVGGLTEVLIEARTGAAGYQLFGNQAVWIQAVYRGVDLSTRADSECACAFGEAFAPAKTDVATTAKVTARNESFIETADLTVDANQFRTRWERDDYAHGGAFVGHYGDKQGAFNANRNIFWEATVTMLGEPNPELVVDATGTIVKLVNVTVTDELGNVYGLGSTIPAGRQIWVGDLRNDRAGLARFRANDLADAPTSRIWGNAGLFNYQETWDYVRITNASNRTLVIHLIDVVNGTQTPIITISAERVPGPVDNPANNVSLDEGNSLGATFEFDLTHSFPATRIEIRNTQTGTTANSDIVLEGQLSGAANGVTINNPIGTTIIDNQRGNIVVGTAAARPFLLLRTNVLALNADGGSIGTHTRSTGGVITARSPIPVELIQFVDASNVLRAVSLTVEAGTDAVLDLRAVRRETVSATPFVVTVASLRAGSDLDLVINDSNQQQAAAVALPAVVIGVFAPTTSYGTPRLFLEPPLAPNDTCAGCPSYHGHFRPSTNTPDTNVGAFAGIGTPVNSAYTFADARAGRDISIRHTSTATTITFTATTDVDATLTDLGTGATLSTADDNGKIDMTTNGFVTVTERSGDLRVGDITSTASNVTLTSPARILDAERGDGLLGSDPTPADVTGVNITLTAGTGLTTGGIGLPGNFLEINVGTGVLNAFDRLAASTLGIYLTETDGDMRVDTVWTRGDAALTTVAGSIRDARNGGAGDAEANIFATSVDLDANGAGASIGEAANDLEIESSHAAPGDVGLQAAANIYLTETRGTLRLVLAEALGGDIRITVRETATSTPAPPAAAFTGQVTFNGTTLTGAFAAGGFLPNTTLRITGGTPYDGDYTIVSVTATTITLSATLATTNDVRTGVTLTGLGTLDEDLDLVHDGAVRFVENVLRTVARGRVAASGAVLLRVGDDVTTTTNSEIAAGRDIDVYGDWSNGDPHFGTTMLLLGTITPGAGFLTRIWGQTDVDRFQFGDPGGLAGTTTLDSPGYILLGGKTRVFGDLGEDVFTVLYLQTMNVAAGHTLTLDGQAGSDRYEVYTTGSQGSQRNYVVNLLDTGAPGDGVDEAAIYGRDTLYGAPAPADTKYEADDIFLLRAAQSIAGETTNRPAYVALLAGSGGAPSSSALDCAAGNDLDCYRDTITGNEPSTFVQRINYDSALNGRLTVYGRGGNDAFLVDDTTAIVTLDGGADDDSFQIGQIFGSKRDVLEGGLAAADVFPLLIATTRGWLSPGTRRAAGRAGRLGQRRVHRLLQPGRAAPRRRRRQRQLRRARLRARRGRHRHQRRRCARRAHDPAMAGRHDPAGRQPRRAARPRPRPRGRWTSARVPATTRSPTTSTLRSRSTAAPASTRSSCSAPSSPTTSSSPRRASSARASTSATPAWRSSRSTGSRATTCSSSSRRPFGVAYRVIGGLGSDTINVTGDVTEDIVVKQLEGLHGHIDHIVGSGDLAYDGLVVDGHRRQRGRRRPAAT